MPADTASSPLPAAFETDVPARLDRLPWSRFHLPDELASANDQGLAGGDFNGDKVQDVAVVENQRLTLYPGQIGGAYAQGEQYAGALPMTGVIVRSSANVQAGAQTRLSTMLHGIWILGFVALLPWLLREIPMAALGAVLVVTGAKLVNVSHAKHLLRAYGPLPVLIWAVTLALVVAEDLLTGVLFLSIVGAAAYAATHRVFQKSRLRVAERYEHRRPRRDIDGATKGFEHGTGI